MKLQGDHSTLGNVLLTMDVLIQHMKNSLRQLRVNKDLKRRIEHAWEKFDKYYKSGETQKFYEEFLAFRNIDVKKAPPIISTRHKNWEPGRIASTGCALIPTPLS